MKKTVFILTLIVISICSGCGWINMASYNREEIIEKINKATTIAELEALYRVGSMQFEGVGQPYLRDVDKYASDKLYAKIDSIREKERNKRNQEKRQKRIKYVYKIYGKDSSIGDTIINEKICLGMTKEDVIISWGEPKNGINKTVGSWGVNEQWIYGWTSIPGYYGRGVSLRAIPGHYGPYLYFEDGILTSWQD